jgi:hypothetical protein
MGKVQRAVSSRQPRRPLLSLLHGFHRRRDPAQRPPPWRGECPFAAIVRDPVGGPLVKAGAMLVHRLQQQPKATVN